MKDQYTVAHYMKDRLEELGLDRMFGVAGNYTAALLDTILAENAPKISISGCANELTAGYAADAYARYKGIGAVYVTYSVGAFIALNPISGSFVEKAPVVLINGAPTNKEDNMEKNAGLLYSHTTGYQFVDIHMFRPVTAAAERITNGKQAPFQIDSALTALLSEKRPVYFEVTEDVWRVPCPRPTSKLETGRSAIITNSGVDLEKAVAETMAIITKDVSLLTKDHDKKREVLFWAGVEIQRYGLQEKFLELLRVVNSLAEDTGFPIGFVTSPLSKSVISENHKYFKGCLTMTRETIDDLIGETGCVIGIGAWTVGKDVHNQNIRSEATVLASHGGLLAGAKYIPMVPLEAYIDGLIEAFEQLADKKRDIFRALELERPIIHALNLRSAKPQPMSYNLFFRDLENFVNEEHIVVADAGFPLIGAQSLHIPSRNGFVGQAAWLSIGYSVGAATGIKCANPEKRVLVVVGDGAFHETCQALSDHMANGHNTVVFLMNNGTYGIEQYIVNPNPYRETPVKYPSEPKSSDLQNHIYPYNKLPSWNFMSLADTFGARGIKVEHTADMQEAMKSIAKYPDDRFLVEICLPSNDSPGKLSKAAMDDVGEDEINHPGWPPAGKF